MAKTSKKWTSSFGATLGAMALCAAALSSCAPTVGPTGAPVIDPAAAAEKAVGAKTAMAEQNYPSALGLFAQAHAMDPDNRDYVHNAAAIAQALGETEQALGFFRDALMLAMADGAKADVQAYAAEISKLVEAEPTWIEERRQAASAFAPERQGVLGIWQRSHQGAIAAINSGDADKAVRLGRQALSVAGDNLGANHIATIISGLDLGRIYYAAGQVEEAEAVLDQAAQASAKALGPGHPQTIDVLKAQADGLVSRALLAPATDIQRDILTRIGAAEGLGADHPQALKAKLALARTLENRSLYGEAVDLLNQACGEFKAVYGALHPQSAACLVQKGELVIEQGEYAEANALYAEAATFLRGAYSDTARDVLDLDIKIAKLRRKQGDLASARQLLDDVVLRARRAAEAGGGEDLVYSAKVDLIELLDAQGEFAKAETIANEVLAYQSRSLGKTHPNTLSTLTALASVFRKQGRLIEAEATFRDAYESYRDVLGDDHRSTVIAANNLGEVLEKSGLYDRAEPVLYEALQQGNKVFGETSPSTMVTMNNLALLYESQGTFDKAEPLYQSAINIFEKRFGPSHPDTIAVVNNLAYLYLLQQDYAQALPLFERVLAAWTDTYGARHINTFKALNNLARTMQHLGRLDEARDRFEDALDGRRALLGERHLDTQRSMHDMALLLREEGKLAEAQALLEETLALNEAVLGAYHPYTFETSNSLARVLEERQDKSGALDVRKRVYERRNTFLDRMLPVTGDNAREGYIRLHSPELAAYLRLVQTLPPQQAGHDVLAISAARKGLLLKVASDIAQITRLSGDPNMTRLTADLIEARKKLASLTLSGPTEETKDTHLELINDLEVRINELQGELGRTSILYRETVGKVALDDVVKALPDGAALVDFMIFSKADGGRQLVAGILRKDRGKPIYDLVDYGDPAAIEASVLKYRTDIQDEEIDWDDMLESGAAMYEMLWAPLAPALEDAEKVFVVPDGVLNILPFSALVDDEDLFLIESTDLHLLTSSRDLLPTAIPAATGGYIINAGPNYDDASVVGKDVLDQVQKKRSSTRVLESLRGMSNGMRGLRFDPLPGAEKEGRLIIEQVEGEGIKSVMYNKSEAQEIRLKEMDEAPEILHIATHGFFLKADDTLRKRLLKLQRGADIQIPPPGDNPLLRAGLAFSGINANAQFLGEIDTDNDGVLTALEVLSLNLAGTRLAILSACETGLGEIHEGEGVYGLRRSFQEAGVESVVASLWEVSDAGTQTLMTAFYGRLLEGMTAHDALRESQLEMLASGRWSMPYIWSAFALVGR